MSESSWIEPAVFIAALENVERERSPWPGPRPLAEGETDLLVGREKDLATFVNAITYYRLVHLTGVSGVGKSSLLLAGIVPELQRRDYVVATCRDWSNFTGEDFDIVLARRLHDSLPPDQQAQMPRDTDLFWRFHELAGRGIIILDQFEEIVRQSRATRDEVLDFLTELYVATDIPVVLSYRSEYTYAFRQLDQDMRIDRTFAQEIEPVSSVAARELITRPRRPEGAPPEWDYTHVIDADAIDPVFQEWAGTQDSVASGLVPIGMLHFQALLYVLADRAAGRISRATFTAFTEDARDRGLTQPSDRMALALEESAQRRLELAQGVAEDLDMDEYLREGIGITLTDVLPRLSSGGFKLERDVVELADQVLELERRQLGEWFRDTAPELTVTEFEDVVAESVVLLSSPANATVHGAAALSANRADLASTIDARLDAPLGPDRWQQLLGMPDGRGTVVGPLMGRNPLVAWLETMRRFGWALIWLHHLNLARVNSSGDTTSVTLVHDGLGDALRNWATRYQEVNPTSALYALFAPEGKEHVWAGQDELSGQPDNPRVLINLGIKGNSIIRAALQDVVFANCDFRGVLFLRCSFEGVTFVNCLLDGALFSECTIQGTPVEGVETTGYDRDEPTAYVLSDHDGLIRRLLTQYLDDAVDGAAVLSEEPGSPVTLGGAENRPQLVPAVSGLCIQGSRLSALTMRDTRFVGTARLALAGVRGSGLDVAELNWPADPEERPRLVVRSSLLRHVAFSGQSGSRGIEAEVIGSDIAQWWIGAGLRGCLTVQESTVGQLWIEPGAEEFELDIAGSHVAGLVVAGAAIADESMSPDELARFRASTRFMDYRRA